MFSMTAVLYSLQGTLTTIGPLVITIYLWSKLTPSPVTPPSPHHLRQKPEMREGCWLVKGWGRTLENNLGRNYLLCIGKWEALEGVWWKFFTFPSPLEVAWALWVVKASELGKVTWPPSGYRVVCTYQVLQDSPLPSQEQGRPHIKKVKPGLLS